jgi:hypothetical protein
MVTPVVARFNVIRDEPAPPPAKGQAVLNDDVLDHAAAKLVEGGEQSQVLRAKLNVI